jgi:hypothetical protein
VSVRGNVHVPLNCPRCAGPLEVACEVQADIDAETVRFRCPYCGTLREFVAPGHVLWVAMRQFGESRETRH